MSGIGIELEALIIQVIFFIISIIGSYVVLILLKGTAAVKHKGAQFGGAAAMFVAMYWLLNSNFSHTHDIIVKANASSVAQSIMTTTGGEQKLSNLSVSVTPDRQIITERDFARLDRNKYFVSDSLKVAAQKPGEGRWTFEDVNLVPDVGLLDTFVGHLSFTTMSGLIGTTGARKTVAIRINNNRVIRLNLESEVDGIRCDYNPFDDDEVIKNIAELQIESARIGLPPEKEKELDDPETRKKFLDMTVSAFNAETKRHINKKIQKTYPIEKNFISGIYVSRFKFNDLPQNPMMRLLVSQRSILDRAVQVVAFQGGINRNLKVDQSAKTASFSGSVNLRNVVLDGRRTDVSVNNISFIVAGADDIVLVQLLSLSSDSLEQSIMLKNIMDSLLYVL